MGNILFTVDRKHHKKNCVHSYELKRVYIRKSTEPKNDSNDKTSKKFNYGQRFLGYAWACLSCGLIVRSPAICRKCQSENIRPGKNDSWEGRYKKEFYHCLDCKGIFKIKIKSVTYKLVEMS